MAERRIDIEGLTHTGSWLIVIREDYETVKRYILGHRDYLGSRSFLTLQHETVHFWHALSTSFLFFYSSDYLALCLQVVGDFARSNKRYSDIPFRKFAQEFSKLNARLQASDADKTDWIEAAEAKLRSGSWHRWQRTQPVPSFTSAKQVIESCAVLCSYRLCYPGSSHDDFRRYLNQHHPGEYLFEYSGAYLFATSILGELAFDLFAPACYIALQAENPGHNFDAILLSAKERIESVSREQIIEDPLTFLLNTINVREDRCFPLAIKHAMSRDSRVPFHPILQPYVERIAQAADDLRVCDFFARPYFYGHYSADSTMQAKLKDFLFDMLPPAHVYAKDLNRCLRTGLGARLGDEYTQRIVALTAIVRLAERLVFGMADPMLCPHDNCPMYRTALCQGYFAYPPNDFRECNFQELLKDLELQSLLESIPT